MIPSKVSCTPPLVYTPRSGLLRLLRVGGAMPFMVSYTPSDSPLTVNGTSDVTDGLVVFNSTALLFITTSMLSNCRVNNGLAKDELPDKIIEMLSFENVPSSLMGTTESTRATNVVPLECSTISSSSSSSRSTLCNFFSFSLSRGRHTQFSSSMTAIPWTVSASKITLLKKKNKFLVFNAASLGQREFTPIAMDIAASSTLLTTLVPLEKKDRYGRFIAKSAAAIRNNKDKQDSWIMHPVRPGSNAAITFTKSSSHSPVKPK